MPNTKPVTILFDVMDTIIHDPFYTAMPAYFGLSFEQLLKQKHPSAWIDFESNKLTEDEFFAQFFTDGRPIDKHDFIEKALKTQYRYLPGMESMLSKLKASGYDMRTFSNYPVWYEYIEEVCQVSKYVEWEFVSCKGVLARHGARKPSESSFELVLRELKNEGVDRVVFVDDRESNVEAARKVGMEGVLFEGAGALEEALREMNIRASFPPTSAP